MRWRRVCRRAPGVASPPLYAGRGAGGGAGFGPVTYDHEDPPAGSVLVTTTLTPGLGPLLPRLKGIVAETGSVLAHLAILAREARVPTVVGYAGATSDLPEGAVVLVSHDVGFVSKLVRTVICVNRAVSVHCASELGGDAIVALYGRDVHMVHHDHDCRHEGGHH